MNKKFIEFQQFLDIYIKPNSKRLKRLLKLSTSQDIGIKIHVIAQQRKTYQNNS